ncbi:hypothetical protein P5673_012406 [Acropora cervicornis]|uniref:Uncharacterized protein n=1 Tax=Acropora cervicornis TaxID=6130 RepID=A0AAD9V7H8_ACRCE|nr:hypothetical protein P5673_012406 [Acropora cervicornis]
MLIIRYTGAEEKAKELQKLLLRPILLPPLVSPASRPDSQPPSTPASLPTSQLPSTPARTPATCTPVTPSNSWLIYKQKQRSCQSCARKLASRPLENKTHDAASEVHHISSVTVLKMQDSITQKETCRTLRKLLPGFIDSERSTEQLQYKWHKEFEVVLQPTRTKTGWQINPERLRKCVSFAYPWLMDVDTEWWCL